MSTVFSAEALFGDTTEIKSNAHQMAEITWSTRRKTSGSRVENQQTQQPTVENLMEPGPHLWEASVLNSAPSGAPNGVVPQNMCSAGVYLLAGKRSIGNLVGKRFLLCWQIVIYFC